MKLVLPDIVWKKSAFWPVASHSISSSAMHASEIGSVRALCIAMSALASFADNVLHVGIYNHKQVQHLVFKSAVMFRLLADGAAHQWIFLQVRLLVCFSLFERIWEQESFSLASHTL